ncbi:hypothetical protein [Listeria booriae]|uniref:hypothetical protein n=1 Tax=Listeria booriae TaxID=1552123 RepID=UPI00162A43C7|nr:hypothetical protein [Listeria booriae]MBC2164641.1 hypothetical protein [Listeria booriae]
MSSKQEYEVRQEVKLFAEQMEKRLQAHDNRPGWRNEQNDYLYVLMHAKVELMGVTSPSEKELILKLATDIANFAMMIHDNTCKKELQSKYKETN